VSSMLEVNENTRISFIINKSLLLQYKKYNTKGRLIKYLVKINLGRKF
jgi:hypothetical protein